MCKVTDVSEIHDLEEAVDYLQELSDRLVNDHLDSTNDHLKWAIEKVLDAIDDVEQVLKDRLYYEKLEEEFYTELQRDLEETIREFTEKKKDSFEEVGDDGTW